MIITDRVLQQLDNGGAQTLSKLLAAVPELAADPYGAETLRLLLRLDRRVRRLPDGRWTLAAKAQTPETRIIDSAQAYLDRLPGSGMMLDSLVKHVAQETNYDPARVRSVIISRFITRGNSVLNKRKETV